MKIVEKYRIWYALFLIFFVAAILRYFFLSKEAIAPGSDTAWYYIRTLDMLHGKPSFYAFATPPVYFLLSAFFSIFTGINTAINLVAIMSSLAVFTTFIFVKHLFKSNDIALLSSSLVAFTTPLLYLMWQAKKNALAMVFVPLLLYFFFKSKENKNYRPLTIIAAFLIFFTHPQIAGLTMLMLPAYFAFEIGHNKKIDKEDIKNLILVGIVIIITFLGEIIGSSTLLVRTENFESTFSFGEIFDKYGLFLIPALIGLIISLGKGKRNHFFIAIWFIFLILMAQPIILTYSYRVVWVLFYPIIILTAIFLNEIKIHFGKSIFYGLAILISFVGFLQFWSLGMDMYPDVYFSQIRSLNESLQKVSDNSILVVTDEQTMYWAKYVAYNKDFIYTNSSITLKTISTIPRTIIGNNKDVWSYDVVNDKLSFYNSDSGGIFEINSKVCIQHDTKVWNLHSNEICLGIPAIYNNKTENCFIDTNSIDSRKISYGYVKFFGMNYDYYGNPMDYYLIDNNISDSIELNPDMVCYTITGSVFRGAKQLKGNWTIYLELERVGELPKTKPKIEMPKIIEIPPLKYRILPKSEFVLFEKIIDEENIFLYFRKFIDLAIIIFASPIIILDLIQIPMKATIKLLICVPLMFLFWGFLFGKIKCMVLRLKRKIPKKYRQQAPVRTDNLG